MGPFGIFLNVVFNFVGRLGCVEVGSAQAIFLSGNTILNYSLEKTNIVRNLFVIL